MAGAAWLASRLRLGLALDRPLPAGELQRRAEQVAEAAPRWNSRRSYDARLLVLGSQALALAGGEAQERWSERVPKIVTRSQRRAASTRGSWDPDRFAVPASPPGGRVGCTAWMALCLEADFRYGSPGVAGSGDGTGGRFASRRSGRRELSAGRDVDRALREGLEWLERYQRADGSWIHGDPDKNSHAPGLTGLALLAFLGEGQTISHGPYQATVASGVKWLCDNQDPDSGLIGSIRSHDFLYDHAIATTALCEAYYATPSPILEAPARRAVEYCLSARNPWGVWRYDVPPKGENDTSVTAWMVQALATAATAGLEVDPDAFTGTLVWLELVTDPETGRVGYDSFGSLSSRTVPNEHFPREKGEAMTAAGLFMRVLIAAVDGRENPELPPLEAHAELMRRTLPEWDPDGFGIDMYYWYYGTYAMYQMGGKSWKAWERALLRAVLPSRETEGAERGSWSPAGAWGYAGGRVYATALMVLTLQVYFRYDRLR